MPKINYNEIKFKRNPKEPYYLDLKTVIKKKKFLNFIVSSRRMGKTYSATRDVVVASWFEHRYQTMWLRRFLPQIQADLEDTSWWPQVVEDYCIQHKIFPSDYVATNDKGIFYINDEPVMTMRSLTEAITLKGHGRKGIANVIFDEFIEKDRWKYIAPAENEPTNYFLKTLSTVLRDDDIPAKDRHVYLLSNAESLANPYFNEWDLVDRINLDTEWLISENALLWIPRMSEALYADLMADPLYQVIADTKYADVALNNTFFDGGTLNIKEKLLPNSKQLFCLQLYGSDYFVYEQKENEEYYFYITKKGTYGNKRFAMNFKSIQDAKETVIPSDVLSNLRDAMSQNMLRFDGIKTRSIFMDSVKGRYM